MNRIRRVAIGTLLAATVVGVGIAGVSAANAAAPGGAQPIDQPAGEQTNVGRVSVGDDGAVTSTGDVVPVDPADMPVWDAETERKIEEASAAYHDGAIISIDENGDVTAEPLRGDSGVVTHTAEASAEED